MTNLTPETTVETIARIRAKGKGADYILSALGHPGYGAKFAKAAIARMEATGMSPHQAVYGKGSIWA